MLSYVHAPLFSMDEQINSTQQTNSGLSSAEIIDNIIEAINKKYSSNSYTYDILEWLRLTSQDYGDIIEIVHAHYPQITNSAIQSIYNENRFFSSAIDYFIKQASKNLEFITANNINTLAHPKNQQPILELNKLFLPLKTYVMNQALKKIKYSYDIVLGGEHKNYIKSFDICEKSHQAITCSHNEKYADDTWNSQLILWDLTTGKLAHAFNESDPIGLVALSPHGSLIAGGIYKENTIKIWCSNTKQLLHKLTSNYAIDIMAFSQPTGSILTGITSRGGANNLRENSVLTQWILTPLDNTLGEQINCGYVFGGNSKECWPFSGNTYSAHVNQLSSENNKLYITKKNCIPLYLCMQAINKTPHLKQGLIESSVSYHQLTSLEMGKINSEIQKKLTVTTKQ